MTQYKPTEKPTQYYLPNKWAKYLSYEPETGMGYQVADIYLKGKTLILKEAKNDTIQTNTKTNTILPAQKMG